MACSFQGQTRKLQLEPRMVDISSDAFLGRSTDVKLTEQNRTDMVVPARRALISPGEVSGAVPNNGPSTS
jgi:hypothetical protein